MHAALLALALLAAAHAAGAGSPPRHFSAAELRAARFTPGVVDNAAFAPAPGAARAREGFEGTIMLREAPMATTPAPLEPARVLGRDPALFPAVELAFFTVDGDLVPVTQEVIRAGTSAAGRSFWDVIVQPGQVWSEAGDGGWSRAGFPFALVNSLEGETHNGLATFLYRGREVTQLRYQVVQQTAPFLVPQRFTASGVVPARYRAEGVAERAALERRYRASLADAVRILPWSALESRVGADRLAGFDGPLAADDLVASGLDVEGTLYLRDCPSAGGPLTWCERARFGVWSATKALANAVALLHLAQKYGPGVLELRIRDYVTEAAARPGWESVRFVDAINMATGIGNGSTRTTPNHSGDGYLEGSYGTWYEARSRADKVAKLLATGGVYPWGPGRITRYRDQDMFILGVAMDSFVKSREGAAGSLWSMLEREVFEPIGIHYAPINRTIEPDASAGQPLMAYGYYPTLGDLVKIARLFQAGGRAGGEQILFAPLVRALSAGADARGLPTGQTSRFGETHYFFAFWETRYDATQGCRLYLPVMEGWGGNLVALLPGRLTALQLAKAAEDESGWGERVVALATVGNRLVDFCR